MVHFRLTFALIACDHGSTVGLRHTLEPSRRRSRRPPVQNIYGRRLLLLSPHPSTTPHLVSLHHFPMHCNKSQLIRIYHRRCLWNQRNASSPQPNRNVSLDFPLGLVLDQRYGVPGWDAQRRARVGTALRTRRTIQPLVILALKPELQQMSRKEP